MKQTTTFFQLLAIGVVTCSFLFLNNNLFAQGQVTTSGYTPNNGSGGITFNLSSNAPIVVDTIWCTFYGSTSMTVDIWYSPTAINGAPTITTGNGWSIVATATLTPIQTAFANAPIQQIPVEVALPMPANSTYGFFIEGTGGSVAYTSYVSGNPFTFTDGTITINTGPNVGYGGNSPNPTFSVRQYSGRVVYSKQTVESYPYCEGFEDDDGGWEDSGISSTWEWGQPNNTAISSAASGVNAWVTDLDGDHNNDEYSYVFSPEFDLTSLTDPYFKAFISRDLQSSDGVLFQVSTDSMNSWSTVGNTSSPSPWYNSSNIPSLAFFGGTNGWTGSFNAWTEMKHSLAAVSNDTSVFFRFAMATDGSTTNEGFGFDDIVVAESDDIEYVELIAPDSVCGSSNTEVSAYLCNKSVEPQTGFSIVLDTGGTNITVNVSDTIPVCGCDTFTLFSASTANGANWNMSSWVVNSGDVNINNDSAFADALIFPIPTGDVTGGGSYCQGDVAQLTFTFNGTQPFNLSFTDGSNGTFIPGIDSNAFVYTTFTGGNFEIIALSDASGCPGDTGAFGGVANVVFTPAPPLDLGPDSTICSGYELDAGAGMASYAWNTGASTQTITPTQSGTYTVTITDNNGCDNTDEIELDVNPTPVVNLEDTVLCEGSTFTFNAGGGYQSYLWDDGSTGQVRIVNSLTTVFVTVTDFSGCEGTGTASITSVVPLPSPNVQNQSGLAPVTLDAGAGYASYQWVTGATTQTIDVFNSGTYTVTVTDDSGCEGEDAGNASIWPNGIKDIELDENGVAVYPNPASNFINIVSAEHSGSIQVEMQDINGRILVDQVLNEISEKQYRLDLPESISVGQYIVVVKDNYNTVLSRKKILVQ